jgi:hypothetical protein
MNPKRPLHEALCASQLGSCECCVLVYECCVLHLDVYILNVFSKTKLQLLKGNSEIRKGTNKEKCV